MIQVTPAPESGPIIAGLQSQSVDFARGFRPRGTKDWLLVATLTGLGFVQAGGKRRILRRGDLLLFAPDTAQDYGYLADDSDWHNIWVHVRPRPHWAAWMTWPVLAKGVMVLSTGQEFAPVEDALRGTVGADAQPMRLRQDLAMNSLAMNSFERALILSDALNPAQPRLDPRIAKALVIIGENLASAMTVNMLSSAVGLSRSRFSVLFAAQTALSPQAYVETQRLTRAAQMLVVSGWPVSHIAAEVGFADPYYFSTRFRQHYGIPPKTYRMRANPV